jgi:hypothetical protein
MKFKYPLICIKWDDACADNSWVDLKDPELKEAVVITLGFLIKENKKHILIASTYDEANMNCSIQIPKHSIISREEITVNKEDE